MRDYNQGSFQEFQKAVQAKKQVICFGAGAYAEKSLKNSSSWIDIKNISYFVDNDKTKRGKTIKINNQEIEIFSPDRLLEEDGENIIVLVTAQRPTEIVKQLQFSVGDKIQWFIYSEMYAKRELELLFAQKEDAAFILLYSPDYYNLGDHAIAVAEKMFLQKYFSNSIIEIGSDLCQVGLEMLQGYVTEKDIIFVTGGGYMGTLWPIGETVVRKTVSLFPENAIIVFPQSIYYGRTTKEQLDLEISKKVYNNHKNLLLCGRDKISFRFMQEEYPACNHYLIPDMVLFMSGFKSDTKREGITFCLRDDKESTLQEETKQRLYNMAVKHREQITYIDNFACIEDGITHKVGEVFVTKKLMEYQKSELMITDRLHGIIFSAITSTPCIALDNSYHKNRALFQWLSGLSYIVFCDILNETDIDKQAGELLQEGGTPYDNSMFLKYFKELAGYIEKLPHVLSRETEK